MFLDWVLIACIVGYCYSGWFSCFLPRPKSITIYVYARRLDCPFLQEAVNFVRLRLSENGGDLSGAADGLTKLALDQGSVDNVSAVLVWFEKSADEEAARRPQKQQLLQNKQQQHRPHQQTQPKQQQQPHRRVSSPPFGSAPRPHVAPD